MIPAEAESPGSATVHKTAELARVIADLCMSSGLVSVGAVDCALSMARELVRAHAYEKQAIRGS